jgi:MOSC domain-containing protein YiiM
MKVLSVNVGGPAVIRWQGREIRTSIRKSPVSGSITFRGVNLVGDDQSDRRVHGGPLKAVYTYPSEHYPFWARELSRKDLTFGAFGENLTTEGWTEPETRVGDVVRIGTAEFEVVSPRTPCYKLEASFQISDMIRRFHESKRSGFYLRGVQDGVLSAGDEIMLIARKPNAPSISDILRSETLRAEHS